MPRSERTQRMSVLVTTQMKVSSGVGPHSCVSRKNTSASSAPSWRLHLLHSERRRARQRGVIRELRRQPLVDFRDPRIDGGEPGIVLCFGFRIALGGVLAESGIAQRVAPLPFRHEVLALAYQAPQAPDRP